ncbi:MAG TPA: hypothetical protein VNZ45_01010 [Bacteroidia bacterium]|nr:hypothetical protein [Bacteroidia bacterium]
MGELSAVYSLLFAGAKVSISFRLKRAGYELPGVRSSREDGLLPEWHPLILQYKSNRGCISLLKETSAGKTIGTGVTAFFSQVDKLITNPSNKKNTALRLLIGINDFQFI